MDVVVRNATLADLETLVAYNAALARETEKLALDLARLRRGVGAVFDDPSRGFYLLAETEGRVVAQLLITFEWSDWRNGVFWWIQSVYVEPAYRGRGVYGRLHRAVVERARSLGNVCGLRLYVESGNHPAQRAYQRLGMAKTVYDMYEVDFVIQR